MLVKYYISSIHVQSAACNEYARKKWVRFSYPTAQDQNKAYSLELDILTRVNLHVKVIELTLYQVCLGSGNPVTVQRISTSVPSMIVIAEGPNLREGGIPETVKVPLSVELPCDVEATHVYVPGELNGERTKKTLLKCCKHLIAFDLES